MSRLRPPALQSRHLHSGWIFPLTATPRHRGSVPEPEETAKLAIARRAKPGAPPGYVTTKRPSHPIC